MSTGERYESRPRCEIEAGQSAVQGTVVGALV